MESHSEWLKIYESGTRDKFMIKAQMQVSTWQSAWKDHSYKWYPWLLWEPKFQSTFRNIMTGTYDQCLTFTSAFYSLTQTLYSSLNKGCNEQSWFLQSLWMWSHIENQSLTAYYRTLWIILSIIPSNLIKGSIHATDRSYTASILFYGWNMCTIPVVSCDFPCH